VTKEGNREGEVSDIRERLVRLEARVENLNKRVDSLSEYAKELYGYLQKIRK
jgi:uncharacterized protein YlxW (UPF0749 family)